MELFEAIKARYSCRKLKAVDIPKEDIEKILDAGRLAPSGANRQPFDFLVVTDKDKIAEFSKSQSFMSNASVIIALVADPAKSNYWLEDISSAATNMLLAITAIGYGSTWVEGKIMPNEPELKELLGVDENLRMIIALPIGKPAEPGAQPKKRDLKEMTHSNKW